jgi:hypothetical protein
MSDKERPLPKPPTKAFGRKNSFEHREEPPPLIADRMAQAAAEGKLDEFLKKEMPDNEYARSLAGMMMGMTGMMPDMNPLLAPNQQTGEERQGPESTSPSETAEVPEDVRQAIMGGDLQSLMGLLMREHQKRNPDAAVEPHEEKKPASPAPAAGQPAIGKEIIDALIRIAADNSVTLDWILLRAIKVYVQEYQRTGRL